jgi:5-methyltetrahydropteroyltriglutamate--homocysteine methyltransferase
MLRANNSREYGREGMKRSTDRILTTHIGSLPRPRQLVEGYQALETGQAFDKAAHEARVKSEVARIVRKQVECGLDGVNDGEFGKSSFLTYVNTRLAGFEQSKEPIVPPWFKSKEGTSFPEFYEEAARLRSTGGPTPGFIRMICTGPIKWTGRAALERDIANFRAALKGLDAVEPFIPAISPANVEGWQTNRYYATEEEYLYAIADAMREEYKAIVDAGFLLQVDDPILASYYALNNAATIADTRKWAMVRVEALNHALRGIPEDKVRYHTCYSVNIGPRVSDMELKDFIDILLRIKAGAYSFEAANPRHDHEWRLWQTAKLAKDKVLVPGVISHSTVLVEHPELVAQRILNYAGVVGRERVIAGADCGFASFAMATPEIHDSIVWAKMKALVDGARIASRELWRTAGAPAARRAPAPRKRAASRKAAARGRAARPAVRKKAARPQRAKARARR